MTTSVYRMYSDSSSPFKIGISNNPSKRLKQVQTGSPVRLQLEIIAVFNNRQDAFNLEKSLHSKLAQFRLSGEWFNHTALPIFNKLVSKQTVNSPKKARKATNYFYYSKDSMWTEKRIIARHKLEPSEKTLVAFNEVMSFNWTDNDRIRLNQLAQKEIELWKQEDINLSLRNSQKIKESIILAFCALFFLSPVIFIGCLAVRDYNLVQEQGYY